ncbi:MAG: NAD(P)H-hydrate dehydratase [Mucilaginibacter sp.]
MLPLLTAPQICEADAYTIVHEPVTSVDLMERAAKAFTDYFVEHFPDKSKAITIYCGTGNNGGDGLVIAQLLHYLEYANLTVKIARFSDKASDDFNVNLQRIKQTSIPTVILAPGNAIAPETGTILIDALLGSGLNKPLGGDLKNLVAYLNTLNAEVVAVDVPTGFFTEGILNPDAVVFKADLAITIQQPRLNFLLPESATAMRSWQFVDIGIDKDFMQSLQSPYQWVEEEDIAKILKPRRPFSHKGTYGHALIIAGQDKTMGAALLSSAASAYAGAGLTTACIPESGLTALNSYLPELMAISRKGDQQPGIDWTQFSAIAIGPGLGKEESALTLFQNVLNNYHQPVVIDADAINLLAANNQLWAKVPEGSILTPHMKEFDRLFGRHANWWERLETGVQKAKQYGVFIVLKNDYTITFAPDGRVYFNSTGNPAMATGGMGDILTGTIASLLAQKYTPLEACLCGVFVHGRAGDELALPNRLNVVLAGELAKQLPVTMVKLRA